MHISTIYFTTCVIIAIISWIISSVNLHVRIFRYLRFVFSIFLFFCLGFCVLAGAIYIQALADIVNIRKIKKIININYFCYQNMSSSEILQSIEPSSNLGSSSEEEQLLVSHYIIQLQHTTIKVIGKMTVASNTNTA